MSYIKKISLTAIFTAVAYVLSIFLNIPYLSGAGYIQFSDALGVFVSIILGPWYGAFVSAISASLSDLTLGMAQFIPFTIVAKMAINVFVGCLYPKVNKKMSWLILVIGVFLQIPVYFISYVIYFGIGAYLSSVFDLIQWVVTVAVTYGLLLIFQKTILPRYRK